MAALRAELQQLRDTLSHQQESNRRELDTLQTQLRDKVPWGHCEHRAPRCPRPAELRGLWGAGSSGGVQGFPMGAVTPALAWQESREQALQQRVAKERFALVQGTAREAERMVQDALARMEDPAHIGCTGSAGEFPSAHQTQHRTKRPPCCPSQTAAVLRTGTPRVPVLPALCLQIACCPGHWQPPSAQSGCRTHTANSFPTTQVGPAPQARLGRGSPGACGQGGQCPLGLSLVSPLPPQLWAPSCPAWASSPIWSAKPSCRAVPPPTWPPWSPLTVSAARGRAGAGAGRGRHRQGLG